MLPTDQKGHKVRPYGDTHDVVEEYDEESLEKSDKDSTATLDPKLCADVLRR